MNETQAHLLSMFRDVAAVLDAHGIVYYLGYGTALGAVRHNGFIPWDDDIDIIVWDRDLEKINAILPEELGDRYYYHIPRADTHPHVVYRTENFERDLKDRKAPFIDIFPLRDYPSSKVRRFLSFFSIWGIHITVDKMDSIGSMRVYRHLLWIPKFLDKISAMLADDGSGLCVVYNTTFRREVVPAAWYGMPVKHIFEDTESNLPEQNDRILTNFYGDYMTPPPEGERGGAGGYPLSIYKDYLLDKAEHRARGPFPVGKLYKGPQDNAFPQVFKWLSIKSL